MANSDRYLKIDGIEYKVPIIDLKRNEFLEEIFLPLIGKKELVSNITFDNLNKIKVILQNLPKRNLSIYEWELCFQTCGNSFS